MAKIKKTEGLKAILEYIGKGARDTGKAIGKAALDHPFIATGVGAGTLYTMNHKFNSMVDSVVPIPRVPSDVIVKDAQFNKQGDFGEWVGGAAGRMAEWDKNWTNAANQRWRNYGGWGQLSKDIGNTIAAPYYVARDAVGYIDNKVIDPFRQSVRAGYARARGLPVPPRAPAPTPRPMAPELTRFGRYGAIGLMGTAAALAAYNYFNKKANYNPYNSNVRYNPYMTKQAFSWPWSNTASTTTPPRRTPRMPVDVDPTAGMSTLKGLWHNTKTAGPLGWGFMGMQLWDLPSVWKDSWSRAFDPHRYYGYT